VTNPISTLIDRAGATADRLAVVDGSGQYRYRDLLARSAQIARVLDPASGDLEEARVAFLVPPGFEHVATQWAVWRAGAVAVPIAPNYPAAEIAYTLDDAAPIAVVTTAAFAERIGPIAKSRGISTIVSSEISAPAARRIEPILGADRRAMMVYTSGTTGRPKGVVTTHGMLQAQITTLVEAWAWQAPDRGLHVLPLNHVHGIVNALCCPLWVGAAVEFLDPFDPVRCWERLGSGAISFFTAVPTIYARLIAAHDAASDTDRHRWRQGARAARLMCSGSAALPVSVLERWEALTGHRLLERYGMTEIGMALANPLAGERRAGTVGQPLPGVQARLVDESGYPLDRGPGEIQIRGAQVFLEYWNRPGETAAAFRDGWFATGDVAAVEDGYWRLLGRQSTDIIKSAGYKISALEIEETFRQHPAVIDCAVVGRPDPDLGERIGAAVVVSESVEPEPLRQWLEERLARYKVPRDIMVVDDLPRNAMGKVLKPAVRELLSSRAG